MKDVDFIKKCCDKTEHYQVVEHPLHAIWFLRFNNGYNGGLPDLQIGHIPEGSPIYRDLLQSAIDGVNKIARESAQKYSVTMNHSFIEVYDWGFMRQGFMIYLSDCKNEIEAKESALRYIFEQENK